MNLLTYPELTYNSSIGTDRLRLTPKSEAARQAALRADSLAKPSSTQASDEQSKALPFSSASARAQVEAGQSPVSIAFTSHVLGMEKWEGRILEIDPEAGIFTVDLESRTGASFVADFRLSLLAAGDEVPTAVIGDVVYVTVRTVVEGRRESQTSTVRLRRTGRWTETDLAEIKAEVGSLWGGEGQGGSVAD